MKTDPELLNQHAQWCRIAARNKRQPGRGQLLLQWADRLDAMAMERAKPAIRSWPAATPLRLDESF